MRYRLLLTNGPLMFSERYGYTQYFRVGFGYRFRIVRDRTGSRFSFLGTSCQ